MEYTPDEQARLRAAQQHFAQRTDGLTGPRLKAALNVLAGRISLNGREPADAFVQSLAQQALEAMAANERIEAAQAELQGIERTNLEGYRPRDPDFKGRTLARKHELEQTIQGEMARVLGLSKQDHSGAQREAVASYRQEAERQRKADALREAIARQEQTQEAAAIERRAAEIVTAQRKANSNGDGRGD